jgi:hypothetical protein
MFTNVNLAAPIGALALLGTGFTLLVGAILLIQALIVRKSGRAKLFLALMLTFGFAYFGVMLIFSVVSHDKLLARGEEKHFCELDCHLAYSITNTAQAKTIEDNGKPAIAQGQFTIVTIRTRFDETTIGPRRGDGLLYPNGRALTLIDERGNRYRPAIQIGTPMSSPLRPAETYSTQVAFDLPESVKATALLINEDSWETHLIVGHENSPFHGKARFQL